MNLNEHLVALNLTGLVGLKTVRLIEAQYGSLDELMKIDRFSLQIKDCLSSRTANAIFDVYSKKLYEAELELARNNGVEIITIADESYPIGLRNLDNPPLVLYVKGSLCADKSIGVVGTRAPSNYAKLITHDFSGIFASSGVCVVSGLAKGVDTIAHLGALSSNGETISVIGSGLLSIYPQENVKLAQRITYSGAVVSEYPLQSSAAPANFPMRNRIIAGLSDSVLCVQAGLTSGALITCDWALTLGKDVYCIPGNIDDPISFGCNSLIKDGARLALSAEQIMQEVWGIKPKLDEVEKLILDRVSSAKTLFELESQTQIKSNLLSKLIARLIKKGLVVRSDGNRFVLKR